MPSNLKVPCYLRLLGAKYPKDLILGTKGVGLSLLSECHIRPERILKLYPKCNILTSYQLKDSKIVLLASNGIYLKLSDQLIRESDE
jgi:hypothetical protein